MTVAELQKPLQRPRCPNFGSGPTAKPPGVRPAHVAESALLGRSHRSAAGKDRLRQCLDLTRQLLGLPADYLLAIVPGSDTGAIEMALWNMLGPLPISVVHWDEFGSTWAADILSQLKLENQTKSVTSSVYGELPAGIWAPAAEVSWAADDVVFTLNGTTAGVCFPADLMREVIPVEREGLIFVDATSGIFAMEIPWDRVDVLTFSWQKALGGEAAHGMLVLSPRAVQRIEKYVPAWPIPKVFRMRTADGTRLDKQLFEGNVINTVSMLCVQDWIEACQWALANGGLDGMIRRVSQNYKAIETFVDANASWIAFACKDARYRSHTSVTLQLTGASTAAVAHIVSLLEKEAVAFDIGAHRSAPPGLRIWCGPTIELQDIQQFLPWLAWAHRSHHLPQAADTASLPAPTEAKKVLVTDGLAASALSRLRAAGCVVTEKFLSKDEIRSGGLQGFDVVVIRSATSLSGEDLIHNPSVKAVLRAGVGVDNIDVQQATALGMLVMNTPTAATQSVVELALGHFLVGARRLVAADRHLQNGLWAKSHLGNGTELAGKRVGFVGFGRIGRALARVLRAMGCEIHAYDPFLLGSAVSSASSKKNEEVTLHEDCNALFACCTHISVHCNLSDATRRSIGKKQLDLMPGVAPDGTKCGNHLVNCARGGIIDEEAALEALKLGKLATLALDVFEQEPFSSEYAQRLAQAPGCIATPHVGASTIEAQARVGADAAEAILQWIATGRPNPAFVVNPQVLQ